MDLIRARVFIKGQIIIRSSTWVGLKNIMAIVQENYARHIDTRDNINFWTDTWLGKPLIQVIYSPSFSLYAGNINQGLQT